jgi:hypothetical protein
MGNWKKSGKEEEEQSRQEEEECNRMVVFSYNFHIPLNLSYLSLYSTLKISHVKPFWANTPWIGPAPTSSGPALQ